MAAPSKPVDIPTSSTLSPDQLSHTVSIGSLYHKVALVTGASSGLGRAIAQAYAAAGAFVVNADLRPDPPPVPHLSAQEDYKQLDLSTPTVELINADLQSDRTGQPRAAFVQCNVTDPTSVEAAVAFVVQMYGRLDVMVNNAGIAAEMQMPGRIHEQDVSVLDKDLAVNVRGVWLGCKYAISQMLAQPPHASGERGWVINMCSIYGLVGTKRSSAYCASKGAVLQMTKSLALDYAQDQIHVNCINPGFAETSLLEPIKGGGTRAMDGITALHPWGRLARPDDIAKMAVFLAGEGASFITGAAFVVDGGYTAQ